MAAIVSSDDVAWPVVAPSPEPEKKTIARKKAGKPAVACRNDALSEVGLAPRCKKPAGHQLSLTPHEPTI